MKNNKGGTFMAAKKCLECKYFTEKDYSRYGRCKLHGLKEPGDTCDDFTFKQVADGRRTDNLEERVSDLEESVNRLEKIVLK